ncbi:MAG: putative metal ion transporter YfjQ protein [Nitrosopumilales archaeon]|nr:MAG: putative metal ion transporter YfjQ protein [Nitrosopumilales archaeon]
MKKDSIIEKLRHGKKHLEETIEKKITTIEGEKVSWTDLQNPDRSDIEKLAKRFHFNKLNIEDCVTKFELPKFDKYYDHVFFILHFPPLASKTVLPKYSQLSIFVGTDFLVTVHQGELKPLVDLVEIFASDFEPERKHRLMDRSPGALLHEIIDILVDDLMHTMRKIIANLDHIEDGVFDETKSVTKGISLLRREINMLRRIVHALKRIVLEINKNVEKFSKTEEEELTLYFDDVIDHVDKVLDSLEESKETMEIYKDTDFMFSTEKTNKVLAVLTIIFTLAIPATVIGTFYGMNVNLPGSLELEVMFFGPFTTFIVIILASAIPAGLMFLYFRKLGWIS